MKERRIILVLKHQDGNLKDEAVTRIMFICSIAPYLFFFVIFCSVIVNIGHLPLIMDKDYL